MATRYSELRAGMSQESRARAHARAQEIIRALPLDKMRKARNMTQVAMSERLHVAQSEISKIESRSDLYLSTLREYVAALGGELILRAEFPDGSVNIEVGERG